MNITTSREALIVAVELEKRAVSFYERADMVFEDGAIRALLRQLKAEELQHQARFEALIEEEPGKDELSLLLSAEADGLLFAGGLLEAARKGAFESRASLLKYAIDQEQQAMDGYRGFADLCEGEARATFLAIAREEKQHLDKLEGMLRPGQGN